MTQASLNRLLRLHPRIHTVKDESCRVCRIVWDQAMRDPGFTDAMNAGMADLAAGRGHKWPS